MNSPQRARYSAEQVQVLAKKLRELPPIQKKRTGYSGQDVVKMLSKEIAALQKRGYTLEQIASVLRAENLVVATPSLKSYLQRAKPADRESAPKAGPSGDDGQVGGKTSKDEVPPAEGPPEAARE